MKRLIVIPMLFLCLGVFAQMGQAVYNTVVPCRLTAYVPEDSVQISTLETPDAWEFLGADSTNRFININGTDNFSFDGDTLFYAHADSAYLFINYGGSVEAADNNCTVHFGVFIGGTEREQLSVATYCKTSGEIYSIAGIGGVVHVGYNDKIKIMIKSDVATTVTTHHFTISAIKVQ